VVKIIETDRFDGIDRERFAEMLASAPFQIVVKRLAAELARASDECERAGDTTELFRAQGKAAALRMALKLPQAILEEMKMPPR
jgi:hypothetical protein